MKMYFIAIVLPAHLDEEIKKYKALAHERWGCKVGLKSPAHITITPPFYMNDILENDLMHDVDTIASTIESFTIKTKNFSAFKPRTIFIDVEVNSELQNVKSEADNFFKQNEKYKVKIDSRPFHPHITIATRDLRKSAFYEGWEIFKDKSFEKEFVAEGLSVLRHNQKNWDVVHTSQFKKL